jgi:ketosteroid isomerase-like protein
MQRNMRELQRNICGRAQYAAALAACNGTAVTDPHALALRALILAYVALWRLAQSHYAGTAAWRQARAVYVLLKEVR